MSGTTKVVVLEGQELADFKENLERECFGETPKGHCVECKEAFSDRNTWSAAGWREIHISKLCERCFDAMFAEGEGE